MRTRVLIITVGLLLASSSLFAQWVQTALPYTGTVFAVASHGASIFTGTWGSGVYRSTDNGTTWGVADTGLTDNFVHALGVNGSTIFAGTDNLGVFTSTDDGDTWTPLKTTLTYSCVRTFAFSDSVCFAGTTAGLYTWRQGARDWARTDSGMWVVNFRSLIARGDHMLAGTYDGGAYYSTDAGAHWILCTSNVMTASSWSLALVDTVMFTGLYGSGVCMSTDNGVTWTQVNAGLPTMNVYSLCTAGGSVFAGVYAKGVYVLNAARTTWSAANAGLTTGIVGAMTPVGNYLYAGTAAGLWRRPLSEMTTGVDRGNSLVPAAVMLYANFPNPFNPATTIRFSLTHKAVVTLSVYDVLGREVAVLVNGEQEAGSREIRFDGSSLASGMYFGRLEAGGRTSIIMMMLMK